jgi:hypothetical protein
VICLEAGSETQRSIVMPLSKGTWFVAGLATAGLFSGAVTFAIAQAPSQDVISKLDNNQGIFVDKKSFDVVKGASAKADPLATLSKMGAREVSAGAIIFRSGDKLYIVDGTPPSDLPPQAMKDFQSNWNVGYMKSFQDNWNVGYMK